MISTKLNEADKKNLDKGFDLGAQCLKEGIGFYIITASGSDEIKEYNNELTICVADETTLKTIVRANPGYVLLKEGEITGKWSWANIPPKENFVKDLNEQQVQRMNKKSSVLIVYSLSLSVILMLLLINSLFLRKNGEAENRYL
jgi:hypothetical protein